MKTIKNTMIIVGITLTFNLLSSAQWTPAQEREYQAQRDAKDGAALVNALKDMGIEEQQTLNNVTQGNNPQAREQDLTDACSILFSCNDRGLSKDLQKLVYSNLQELQITQELSVKNSGRSLLLQDGVQNNYLLRIQENKVLISEYPSLKRVSLLKDPTDRSTISIIKQLTDKEGNWYIVTASSEDTVVRLWNGRTGKLLQRFDGHLAGIKDVIIFADNVGIIYVASSSEDRTIKLWRADGTCIYTHAEKFTHEKLGFFTHKDRSYMISVKGTFLTIKDAFTGEFIRSFSNGDYINFFDIYQTQESMYIVTVSYKNVISIIDANTGNFLQEWPVDREAIVLAIKTFAYGDPYFLLWSERDHSIRLINALKNQGLGCLYGFDYIPNTISFIFDKNSNPIVAISSADKIRIATFGSGLFEDEVIAQQNLEFVHNLGHLPNPYGGLGFPVTLQRLICSYVHPN